MSAVCGEILTAFWNSYTMEYWMEVFQHLMRMAAIT